MYLNKYEFDGKAYVNIDELNDLIKKERKAIAQRMKQNKADGKESENGMWACAHAQMTTLARKINMSENGEKYVIFCRDSEGKFEFFEELVRRDEIPAFVRRKMPNLDEEDEYATVGGYDYEDAALFDDYDDAEKAAADLENKCGQQGKWHVTKKWMFDTEDNRDALIRIFYDDASKAKPDKKKDRRIPPRYTVWYRDDSDTTLHCMGFVRYEDKMPVFTNRPCKVSWFVDKREAEKVANDLGDGFDVVDMIDQMTAEERLLRAIFKEDGMDCENEDDEE